jgi:hypothetical protein
MIIFYAARHFKRYATDPNALKTSGDPAIRDTDQQRRRNQFP